MRIPARHDAGTARPTDQRALGLPVRQEGFEQLALSGVAMRILAALVILFVSLVPCGRLGAQSGSEKGG